MTLYAEHLIQTLCNADYRKALSLDTIAWLEAELNKALGNCLVCCFVDSCNLDHAGDCAKIGA